jgi:CMP-N,N'-diacetyllegionaminic acid synthase
MNIICIIPARGGSKGIRGKNLIDFCGKPLIAWSIRQAKASKLVNDVYVSSDSDNILSLSQSYGVKIIKRPKRLATDTSSTEEALSHAINQVQKTTKQKIDLIVFLQATSPVRTTQDINAAIKLFMAKKADSLFSASAISDFCIWQSNDGGLKSITYDYKNRGRRQDRKPLYLENGSIYIFNAQTLAKYKNRLGGKIVIYPMPFWKSYEIDNPEDLELCSYYMKRCLKGK